MGGSAVKYFLSSWTCEILLLSWLVMEVRGESPPLFSDCRFWTDPTRHVKYLQQKMGEEGYRIQVWYWWNVKTGKCTECRQCQGPNMVTAVPCHPLSDTVCLDKRDMGQWLAERQGYYFAHPDYHNNDDDNDDEGGQVVYSDTGPSKHISPDIFGIAQYHSSGSAQTRSKTSQVARQRLQESGHSGLKTMQDHGALGSQFANNIRYYTGHDQDTAVLQDDNTADTRPVLQVAKMFLPERMRHDKARHRNNKLLNIKKMLDRGGHNDIDHYYDDQEHEYMNHDQRHFQEDKSYNDHDSNDHFPEDRIHHDYDYYGEEETTTTIRTPTLPLDNVGDIPSEFTTESEFLTLSIGMEDYLDYDDDHKKEMETEGDTAIREIVQLLETDDDNDQHDNQLLMIILGLASTVVILLLSILVYIVFGKSELRQKFSVLDNHVVKGVEMQQKSSKFPEENSSSNVVESDTNDNNVPPAVIRSLRNIRRDVVVDMEGRNSVLR